MQAACTSITYVTTEYMSELRIGGGDYLLQVGSPDVCTRKEEVSVRVAGGRGDACANEISGPVVCLSPVGTAEDINEIDVGSICRIVSIDRQMVLVFAATILPRRERERKVIFRESQDTLNS